LPGRVRSEQYSWDCLRYVRELLMDKLRAPFSTGHGRDADALRSGIVQTACVRWGDQMARGGELIPNLLVNIRPGNFPDGY